MFRIFDKTKNYLFPPGRLQKGKMIVRLYEHPWPDKRVAFVGVGVSEFRYVGSELHIEKVSVDIQAWQQLPKITRATVALEELPDLEVEPGLPDDISDLNGPMTLHLFGIADAPLVVISP